MTIDKKKEAERARPDFFCVKHQSRALGSSLRAPLITFPLATKAGMFSLNHFHLTASPANTCTTWTASRSGRRKISPPPAGVGVEVDNRPRIVNCQHNTTTTQTKGPITDITNTTTNRRTKTRGCQRVTAVPPRLNPSPITTSTPTPTELATYNRRLIAPINEAVYAPGPPRLVDVSCLLNLNLTNLVDVFVGGEVEAADVDVDRVVENITRQLLCVASKQERREKAAPARPSARPQARAHVHTSRQHDARGTTTRTKNQASKQGSPGASREKGGASSPACTLPASSPPPPPKNTWACCDNEESTNAACIVQSTTNIVGEHNF